jgi:hypothetical protein
VSCGRADRRGSRRPARRGGRGRLFRGAPLLALRTGETGCGLRASRTEGDPALEAGFGCITGLLAGRPSRPGTPVPAPSRSRSRTSRIAVLTVLDRANGRAHPPLRTGARPGPPGIARGRARPAGEPVTTAILLPASLAPAAGTGSAAMTWPARLWLRCRAGTAGRDGTPESPARPGGAQCRTIRIPVPDDLDGSQGAEPARLGPDGENLEIDLRARSHARLTQAVSLHIEHGRTVTPAVRRPRHRPVHAHPGTRSRPGPAHQGRPPARDPAQAGPPPSPVMTAAARDREDLARHIRAARLTAPRPAHDRPPPPVPRAARPANPGGHTMNNPVTTIAGQHAQQRPIRAPHDPPGPPGLQPGSITPPRHQIPPRHEPESQQHSHNLKPDDPLVRSANTGHGTPVHLHDGLLPGTGRHASAQPDGGVRMYPMLRHPRPGSGPAGREAR